MHYDAFKTEIFTHTHTHTHIYAYIYICIKQGGVIRERLMLGTSGCVLNR